MIECGYCQDKGGLCANCGCGVDDCDCETPDFEECEFCGMLPPEKE